MKLLNTHNCLHIKQKKKKLDQFSLRQFEVRVVHSTMKSIETLLSFDVLFCNMEIIFHTLLLLVTEGF